MANASVRLTPEEYKAVCLKNIEQLYVFCQHLGAPTSEHFTRIDEHMARWRTFMESWALSVPKEEASKEELKAEAPAEPVEADQAKSKKKGGWPKGKKRTPRAPVSAAA